MSDRSRTGGRQARERPFSRKEAKAVTRRRLLDAALHILDAEGEGALTTTNVTHRVGIAQSSFYVHFVDMEDLLHNMIDDLAVDRLRQTRAARVQSRSAPLDPERLRDTFRVPIGHSIEHPRVFRLLIKSRYDNATPLGAWSRRVFEEHRAALVEDLITAGLPDRTDVDRRRAEMVADAVIALTESLVLGHLEGRYPDVEEIIDMLIVFSSGYLLLLGCNLEPPDQRADTR